ncbi:MAG: hypothetical protein E5V66_33745 [Mesorhizobium sp.]|nr:MAG: hypothetical protein E5V66_33745 [Mesorhizobium sp.]
MHSQLCIGARWKSPVGSPTFDVINPGYRSGEGISTCGSGSMNRLRALEPAHQVALSSSQATGECDAGRDFTRVPDGHIRISLWQPEPSLKEAALRLRHLASNYRREAA